VTAGRFVERLEVRDIAMPVMRVYLAPKVGRGSRAKSPIMVNRAVHAERILKVLLSRNADLPATGCLSDIGSRHLAKDPFRKARPIASGLACRINDLHVPGRVCSVGARPRCDTRDRLKW
jgi:hypothetical protein